MRVLLAFSISMNIIMRGGVGGGEVGVEKVNHRYSKVKHVGTSWI